MKINRDIVKTKTAEHLYYFPNEYGQRDFKFYTRPHF